ncbi:MAG: ATP-binding protein [Erythrobacter sp.]
MNPCRCGCAGDPARNRNRYPRCVEDYPGRLSGPLLDRIDLHVHVASVSVADTVMPAPAEGSSEVASGSPPRVIGSSSAGSAPMPDSTPKRSNIAPGPMPRGANC